MSRFYIFWMTFGGLGVLCVGLSQEPPETKPSDTFVSVMGYVFDDRNGNGTKDAAEQGLPEVGVSNGRQVVKTDSTGRYQLDIDSDDIVFVIKPRNWMTPLTREQIPRFHYVHKPGGSRASQYPGVSPTGPLPPAVDFPLIARPEPDRFRVLAFGDTQPADQGDIDFLAHDIVEEVVGAETAFGVTLGDIVHDDLSLFESLVRTVGLIGIPWYNVLGNHDMNYDSPDDEQSDETFERVFGPSYYSFDYGPVHFIVLDDVVWTWSKSEKKGRYFGGLGRDQLEFIKNDLAHVPADRLVVAMMHIPLVEVEDRQQLFRLLESRSYTLTLAAHEHLQRHELLDAGDGWNGAQPHHHLVNVTTCGSWWKGSPDEVGIPHTTMRDGAPNGYSIITFDGHDYEIEFKAARRPATYQMNIFAPEEISSGESGTTEVVVNVFAGSERSKVRMRVGREGSWIAMTRTERHDPYYARMKEGERGDLKPPGRPLPDIVLSSHIWQALLPANLTPGSHLIEVHTEDMFGQEYTAYRVIRVR